MSGEEGSPTDRELLSRQYFGGFPQKEIAELLHISCENVRVLSLRARRELKQKLEEHGVQVYGFSLIADKETLLALQDCPEVYSVAAQPIW